MVTWYQHPVIAHMTSTCACIRRWGLYTSPNILIAYVD